MKKLRKTCSWIFAASWEVKPGKCDWPVSTMRTLTRRNGYRWTQILSPGIGIGCRCTSRVLLIFCSTKLMSLIDPLPTHGIKNGLASMVGVLYNVARAVRGWKFSLLIIISFKLLINFSSDRSITEWVCSYEIFIKKKKALVFSWSSFLEVTESWRLWHHHQFIPLIE